MGLQCNYNVPYIQQFYSTVAFLGDEDITFTWMTGNKHLTSSFLEFATILGYPFSGAEHPCGDLLHQLGVHPDKTKLTPLYADPRKVGTAVGLLPLYDILLRIFRENIAPIGGNRDAIRSALVNLMHRAYLCATCEDDTADFRFDVMDYIFNEMHDAMVSRRSPPYAPYIMLLIKDKLCSEGGSDIEEDCDEHLPRKLIRKKHQVAAPSYEEVELAGRKPHTGPRMKNADPPSSSAGASGSKGKKLSWWKRTLLCMNIEIHKENYSAYRERTAILYNQSLIARDVRQLQDPSAVLPSPPQSPQYIPYKNWNAEEVNWTQLEREITSAAPEGADDDIPSASSPESSADSDYTDDDDQAK
jgi:hypothetical protein